MTHCAAISAIVELSLVLYICLSRFKFNQSAFCDGCVNVDCTCVIGQDFTLSQGRPQDLAVVGRYLPNCHLNILFCGKQLSYYFLITFSYV